MGAEDQEKRERKERGKRGKGGVGEAKGERREERERERERERARTEDTQSSVHYQKKILKAPVARVHNLFIYLKVKVLTACSLGDERLCRSRCKFSSFSCVLL